VETPRKFITAKLSIRKPGSKALIESFAVINLRGVSTNKTIIYFIAMQTYKELMIYILDHFAIFFKNLRKNKQKKEFNYGRFSSSTSSF
jgi:hypothetical protein